MSTNNFPNNSWYTAGWSNELSDDKPLKRKLLGNELVLFRDKDGKVAALDAMCPHRGADLGIGRVVDGNVQCPFHGWQFNGEGNCVVIPSQCASKRTPKSAVVKKYHLIEQQNILWIWYGDEEPKDSKPPYYDFLEEDYGRGMRRVQDIPMFVDGPYISVVENAIDNTHPPFIHPGTLAGEPEKVAEQFIKFDEDMRGYWGQLDPKDSIHDEVMGTEGMLGFSRRLLGVTKLNREECYFRFDLGSVVYFYDKFESGHEQVALFMVTPADDTSAWFFGEHVRSFAKNSMIDYVIKKWARELNREDGEHVAMMLSSSQAHGITKPVSVVADRPAMAFRRIYFKSLRERVAHHAEDRIQVKTIDSVEPKKESKDIKETREAEIA